MLPDAHRKSATGSIPGLLCCLTVAAAVAGCAGTRTRWGLPWWSQGPGDAVAQAPSVDAPRSAPVQPAGSHGQAVRYGNLLFVSGQLAGEWSATASGGGDIEVQVRTAMDNVQRILEWHGLTMSNVLSVTLYLQDIDGLAKVDEVYSSYFQRSLPARSVVRVNGLPRGSLVEISVIAGR